VLEASDAFLLIPSLGRTSSRRTRSELDGILLREASRNVEPHTHYDGNGRARPANLLRTERDAKTLPLIRQAVRGGKSGAGRLPGLPRR